MRWRRRSARRAPARCSPSGSKGGYEAGVKLVSSLKLFSHLANIGDTRSLVIHPASTTHRQLTDEQRKAAGAGPDVVRLSVGIEDAADIIADLEQGVGSRWGEATSRGQLRSRSNRMLRIAPTTRIAGDHRRQKPAPPAPHADVESERKGDDGGAHSQQPNQHALSHVSCRSRRPPTHPHPRARACSRRASLRCRRSRLQH